MSICRCWRPCASSPDAATMLCLNARDLIQPSIFILAEAAPEATTGHHLFPVTAPMSQERPFSNARLHQASWSLDTSGSSTNRTPRPAARIIEPCILDLDVYLADTLITHNHGLRSTSHLLCVAALGHTPSNSSICASSSIQCRIRRSHCLDPACAHTV